MVNDNFGRTRRKFLKKLSLTFAVIAGSMVGISLLRQVFPRLSESARNVKIGRPSDFPLGTYTYLPDCQLFIYRDHTGIKVVSAVCTHLGCILEKSEEGFQCPCHGSCFNKEGKVLSGAASKDLPWYRLVKDADGKVVVDMTKVVGSDFKLRVS